VSGPPLVVGQPGRLCTGGRSGVVIEAVPLVAAAVGAVVPHARPDQPVVAPRADGVGQRCEPTVQRFCNDGVALRFVPDEG
jgi:hypothetical protein